MNHAISPCEDSRNTRPPMDEHASIIRITGGAENDAILTEY